MSFFATKKSVDNNMTDAGSGTCAICDMNYGRWGNNGAPLVDGRVCNACNSGVVEFRMSCAFGDCKDLSADDREVAAKFKCMTLRCENFAKKIATQSGIIEALRKSVEVEKENAAKFKDELDEIAKDECVAPMIDRIMEDAKKDVDAAEAKAASMEEEMKEAQGHRAQNSRLVSIAAESIYLEQVEPEFREFVEELDDNYDVGEFITISMTIPHPNPLNDLGRSILKVEVANSQEHYRWERQKLAEHIRIRMVDDLRTTNRKDRVEIGGAHPCPHCEECLAYKIQVKRLS